MIAAFDAVYMVDWSSASVPKCGRDSIWLASADVRLGAGLHGAPANLATRAAAWDWLSVLVERCTQTRTRALVGFDFAFGYPQGTAAALGFGEAERCADVAPWAYTWRLIASMIHDAPDNANNRFAVGGALNRRIEANLGVPRGPFWGYVGKMPPPEGLNSKPPPAALACGLPQWRQTEHAMRTEHARRRAQPGWKLAYPGSVGGQALVGIAGLQRLRDAGLPLAVWPFEPQRCAAAAVVVAEVYPSLWPLSTERYDIKDANQVAQVALTLASCADDLAAAMAHTTLPPVALGEEGWVLGVRPILDGSQSNRL